MLSKATFQFLKDLKANNNRDWFLANKDRFDTAKNEFEGFIEQLIKKIAEFDEEMEGVDAKKAIFRIYRDVRFSKDKSPYKTHFGAHISASSKKSEIHNNAGYYIHVGDNESMLAGGAYMPPSDWLLNIRKEIAYNSGEFKKIIEKSDFKKYFGTLEGEKLVKAPKGFDPQHPDIEFLKMKSFLAVNKVGNEVVMSPDFMNYATLVFKAYAPFRKFLNEAD